MLKRINQWLERRRADRAAEAQFDALVDPTFLDRATAKPFELPKYNAIFQKD